VNALNATLNSSSFLGFVRPAILYAAKYSPMEVVNHATADISLKDRLVNCFLILLLNPPKTHSAQFFRVKYALNALKTTI
jgi:hypothetical protein